MKKINIGIVEDDRKQTSKGLSCVLADTYTLYLLTQNFHWNVTGNMFESFHLMFEKQYQELAVSVDTIAERIRALGYPVNATFLDFQELASIKPRRETLSVDGMVENLLDGHESVIRLLRLVAVDANKAKDEGTYDILVDQIKIHEKNAWMLRSSLPS
jgi:starvation-inducible DNA-binding protein